MADHGPEDFLVGDAPIFCQVGAEVARFALPRVTVPDAQVAFDDSRVVVVDRGQPIHDHGAFVVEGFLVDESVHQLERLRRCRLPGGVLDDLAVRGAELAEETPRGRGGGEFRRPDKESGSGVPALPDLAQGLGHRGNLAARQPQLEQSPIEGPSHLAGADAPAVSAGFDQVLEQRAQRVGVLVHQQPGWRGEVSEKNEPVPAGIPRRRSIALHDGQWRPCHAARQARGCAAS